MQRRGYNDNTRYIINDEKYTFYHKKIMEKS